MGEVGVGSWPSNPLEMTHGVTLLRNPWVGYPRAKNCFSTLPPPAKVAGKFGDGGKSGFQLPGPSTSTAPRVDFPRENGRRYEARQHRDFSKPNAVAFTEPVPARFPGRRQRPLWQHVCPRRLPTMRVRLEMLSTGVNHKTPSPMGPLCFPRTSTARIFPAGPPTFGKPVPVIPAWNR